jgi:K+-transporting ATPase ATPase C chain
MKKLFVTATLYTIVTAFVLGIVYPAVVTVLSQAAFRDKADGQIIRRNGEIIGSHLIGQPFTGPGYFHSRPSAAGTGYDASASSGSNLAPTNKALIDRVNISIRQESNGAAVPIDLVTASASGLDPDITPSAAAYQVARVARERHLAETVVEKAVTEHTTPRQFGLLGEPRVNVLELNLAISELKP